MRPAGVTLLLSLLPPALASAARERLIAVGGGRRPPQAMARFVAWAGGKDTRILDQHFVKRQRKNRLFGLILLERKREE